MPRGAPSRGDCFCDEIPGCLLTGCARTGPERPWTSRAVGPDIRGERDSHILADDRGGAVDRGLRGAPHRGRRVRAARLVAELLLRLT